MTISISSSESTISASLASSMSESVMTWKGFEGLGPSNTESCSWLLRRFLGGGGGEASIRHGAFIRGERLIQTVHLREGVYQIQGVYLRVGVNKIIYGISKTKAKTKILRHCF